MSYERNKIDNINYYHVVEHDAMTEFLEKFEKSVKDLKPLVDHEDYIDDDKDDLLSRLNLYEQKLPIIMKIDKLVRELAPRWKQIHAELSRSKKLRVKLLYRETDLFKKLNEAYRSQIEHIRC